MAKPLDDTNPGGGPSFAPFLREIAFPQSRSAIIKLAENDKSDAAFLNRLKEIPESTYNSIEDLRKALGDEYENYGMVKKNVENIAQTNPTSGN